MDVRPILLCATEEDGTTPTLGEPLASALSRQGYIVVHCPPSKMLNFRVLSPCPFTQADVDFMRRVTRVVPQPDDEVVAESIANRMEAML